MKRVIACLAVLFCICALCGCKKNEEERNAEKEADFVYPTEGVSLFCTDEEGNLYAYKKDAGSICVFDKEGVQIKSIPVAEKEYFTLCWGAGALYAVVAGDGETMYMSGACLVEISREDGSLKTLYENPKAYMAQNLTYGAGNLFFIEREPVETGKANLLSDPMGQYYYAGERLMCYSMETGSVKELPVDRIRAFTKKDEKALFVYAYDFDYGKFYFATYEPETGVMGEKSYVGDSFNVHMEDFSYDAECDKLLREDVLKSVMVAIDPTEPDNQSSFYTVDGVLGGIGLRCQEGRSYFLLNGQVHRIKNSNYIKDYEPLRIYYTSKVFEMPEGTGFEINMVKVDEETMAMAMMAGDSDYDFLLLSTDSPVAEQIRRVGAYEPLNKVEGVENYLQESFDFMREAATDTNGAVWMIPCDISCDVLVYHPELCKTYGVDLDTEYSNEMLQRLQKALEEAEESGEPSYYQYNYLSDRTRVLESYLADYAVVNGVASFDTPLFRRYSEWYKAGSDSSNDKVYRYSYLNPGAKAPVFGATEEEVAAYFEEYFSKVAVVATDKRILSQEYSVSVGGGSHGFFDYDFFSAKPMPSLEEEKQGENLADAYILVLNPKSAQLKEAKEFLTVLTERLNGEESIYRTKELAGEYNALERKVHEIYGNSRIVFSYPDDVFWDEYLKYLSGEKSLDEVIPELERKLNLYLKE